MNITDFDDLAPPREQSFVSLDFLCQLLQIMPAQLHVLMEETNVKFSKAVDGIGYLTVADSEAVAEKCRDIRKEATDVAESARYN